MKALSFEGGLRLPLKARMRHGTVYVDGRRWFEDASSPSVAEGGAPLLCVNPRSARFQPPILTPKLRRIVAIDDPCSETSEEERVEGADAKERAKREVEEAVRRGEKREEERRKCLKFVPTAASRIASDAIGPVRSTYLHARGVTCIQPSCMEVVRILPGWYVHRSKCTSWEEADSILSGIAKRYNCESWGKTMQKCVVRPMFGTSGVLQNLPGWLHARAAFLYMILRAGGKEDHPSPQIPDHIRREIANLA